MFSLFGLCGLLFFLYLRPQEAIPALQTVPFLNLLAALGALGAVIDVRLGLARIHPAPALRWVLALGAWGLLCTLIKGGNAAANAAFQRIMIPWIVLLLIAHGVTSFRGLQALLGTVLTLGLAITSVAVHQAQQPFGCFQVQDAWADRELAGGKYDGRPCQEHRDCLEGDAEPGFDYLCEKPGLLGTSSIGHGRVRFRGILQDPNELALAISIVVPLAIGFWARRRTRLRLLLALGTMLFVGLCTIYTRSRSGQLVYMAVLGTYFVRRYGLAVGALTAAVAAVPVLLLGGRSGDEATASARERTEALYAGIDLVIANPLLGVGISRFTEYHFITAHNSYLLAVAEMGFPGFFLWSMVLYVSVKPLLMALRCYHGRSEAAVASTWAMALLASFCGLFVGMMFLSLSYHVVLFIYLGLAGAFYQACRRHDPDFRLYLTLREMAMVLMGNVTLVVLLFVYTRLKAP